MQNFEIDNTNGSALPERVWRQRWRGVVDAPAADVGLIGSLMTHRQKTGYSAGADPIGGSRV